MRALLLRIVLPLLLLFSQQGAVLHELGHLTGSEQHAGQKEQPGSEPCLSCLAFAHLAGAAAPSVPVLALPSFTHALIPADAVAFVAADAPAARSRGPPFSL